MKAPNILGSLLKVFTFLSVLGVLVLAIGIYFYAFYEVAQVIKTIVQGSAEEGEVILKSLKAIDAVLIGVIFFIIGLGLYELFIEPIDNLPDWFHMKDIDQLKSMLVKVTILVMAVSFTGKIVTWDGATDLMGYGIGLGIVILALSYFLNVKIREKKSGQEK